MDSDELQRALLASLSRSEFVPSEALEFVFGWRIVG